MKKPRQASYMNKLFELIKFISWDYLLIFAAFLSIPLLFYDVGDDRYSIETGENFVKITKNLKAYLLSGCFLFASVLSLGLRSYKSRKQKGSVQKENSDQKFDRISDGCLVYFFVFPILIGSLIAVLSQFQFNINLDENGGNVKSGMLFETKYRFSVEDIAYIDMETRRGRLYVIDVIRIKLKNGDDVYPGSNYEGDKAVKSHVENVWGMWIYDSNR